MRTQFLLSLAVLCLYFSGFSQTIPAYNPATDGTNTAYKNQMESIFENVDLSQVPSGILYERGYPFIAIEAFTGQAADSTEGNAMAFGLAYASLTSMVVDSTLALPNPSGYMTVFDTVSANSTVIPVLGMHQVYHTIDSLALEDTLFTQAGGTLADVPGRSRSPYIEKELFLFSPVVVSVNQPGFSLKFDSNHFYSNTGKAVQELALDFGGGLGYLPINFDQEVPVQVAEVGRKEFKVRLTYTDGSVYYTGFDVIATRSTSLISVDDEPNVVHYIDSIPAGMDPSTGRGAGTVNVFLACGRERIEKPFIWAEAYNPEIGIIEQNLNYEAILKRIRHVDGAFEEVRLLDYLNQNGYDIIILDYAVGTDYLPRTAEFIKEAIDWVNIQKHSAGSNAKNIILGQSMGGVCTMQALREMENDGLDHECEKFIIYDSPIRGVNIPLSAQASLLDISSMNVDEPFGDEGPLYSFVAPIRDVLELYYAPATRTMMTNRSPSLRDDTDGVDYDFHAYYSVRGYDTEHLYAGHYNYLHGAMGGMPEDCEVLAIANGSETVTPALGAHNFNAGEKVVDIAADHYAIGTIIAGLLPELVDDEFIADAFSTEEVNSVLNMFLWKTGRTNEIDINLYAMKNQTDFTYYDHESDVSFLLMDIVKHDRRAIIDNGLEVDNAPGGFFGIKNQGIFFPSLPEHIDFEISDVVDEFKMHTWCFTPTGSVLNYVDPGSSDTWQSNLYRSYDDPETDLTNNYMPGIDMYHANPRTDITFDEDPISGREYSNTAHTWFTPDQTEFLLYFIAGSDELDGITSLTSGTTFNYGITDITPSTDYTSARPTRTSGILSSSLTVNNTTLTVNANDRIGITPSPYLPDGLGFAQDESHFVLSLGSDCAGPGVALILENNAEMEIGDGNTRTGSVMVGAGDEIIVRSGATLTIKSGSTVKLNSLGELSIENGGTLIIEDGANLITEYGSTLHFYDGGAIELNGGDALLKLTGELFIHENADFRPTHVGVGSGMVEIGNPDGTIIAGSNSEFTLIGDNDSDPMLKLLEEGRLLFPESMERVFIGTCRVIFRSEIVEPIQSFTTFFTTNANYVVQDNTVALSLHPVVGLYGKSYVQNNTFEDVRFYTNQMEADDGMFLTVRACNFDFSYSKDDPFLDVNGGNVLIDVCDFTGFRSTAVKLMGLTAYSSVTNSHFLADVVADGDVIFCVSENELFLRSNEFDYGRIGLHAYLGQTTLRCNEFNNQTRFGIHADNNTFLEMSQERKVGYNRFTNITDQDIALTVASGLEMHNGYNYFTNTNTTEEIILGTVTFTQDLGTSFSMERNQWNAANTGPATDDVRVLTVGTLDEINYTFAPTMGGTCGQYDPSGPPVYPVAESVGNSLPEIFMPGMPPGEGMRLDSAVRYANGSTKIWSATNDDHVAIDRFNAILMTPLSRQQAQQPMTQYYLSKAYNGLKNTIGYAITDSTILRSNNVTSFDTTVQKYVDVLNYLTAKDTVGLDGYRDRFRYEMDKANLFRMLGYTNTGLQILQNIALCDIDSNERAALNKMMFIYEEEVTRQNIGQSAYHSDTVFTDSSAYTQPAASQATQFYFGSVIQNISTVTYRGCTPAGYQPAIAEKSEGLSFKVYPNPSNGQFNILYELPEHDASEVVVFTPDGKMVYRHVLKDGPQQEVINISNLGSGIYIYAVLIDGEIAETNRISILNQ